MNGGAAGPARTVPGDGAVTGAVAGAGGGTGNRPEREPAAR